MTSPWNSLDINTHKYGKVSYKNIDLFVNIPISTSMHLLLNVYLLLLILLYQAFSFIFPAFLPNDLIKNNWKW